MAFFGFLRSGEFTVTRNLLVGDCLQISDPLFLFQDKLNSTISSYLALCNLSGDFTGHSFSIGAASTAAHVVTSDHWIKTFSRWSSDAYKLYIGSSQSVIASISKSLVC